MKIISLTHTCIIFFISISMLTAQDNMEWILVEDLPGDLSEGSCTSATNCDVSPNQICYALVYTPQVTGTLLSYTTYFKMDCDSDPNNTTITYNMSCVMNDNSEESAICPEFDIRFNLSANSGSLEVEADSRYLIHEICFEVEDGATRTVQLRDDSENSSSLNTANGPAFEILRMSDLLIDADAICSPLPVQYLSFDAKRYGFTSELDWVTAGEIRNDRFEVERSGQGHEFHKIGEVKGAGTTTSVKNYNFVDENPNLGWNYYRLRQVDTDGYYTYSRVRQVVFRNEARPYEFAVSPNPVKGGLTGGFVEISGIGYGEIRVYDVTGKLVKTIIKKVGESSTYVSIKGMEPGVYIFKNDLDQVEKVIVQ